MRVERFAGGDPAEAAARMRALVPGGESVRDDVQAIVDAVRGRRRRGADRRRGAVRRRARPPLRVAPQELDAAAAGLRHDLRCGLELAMANIAAVAGASLGDDADLRLPQGQRIVVRELPVRRAAIYVPGGRNPYPSTVAHGRGHGARRGRGGDRRPLARRAPGGARRVRAVRRRRGLPLRRRARDRRAGLRDRDRSRRADVIAGPGGLHVQEAKRLVSGDVGIDGFLGPSDVFVVAGGDADAELVARDLARAGRARRRDDRRARVARRRAARRRRRAAGRRHGARSAALVEVGGRAARGSRSPRRSRPSTCSSWAARPRRSRRA